MSAILHPNDRYAFIGKTGSGKTRLAMVLAATFAQSLKPPWEVWWLDSKGDPEDLIELRKWGFRNAMSELDRTQTGGLPNALYFRLDPNLADPLYTGDVIVDQAQQIIGMAYERHNVLLVVDEYAQIVQSRTLPGKNLYNVFQRGRGLNVGLIGLTQEPVYIPRQLISSSTHIVLFSVTYTYDIEYVTKIYKSYTPPIKKHDKYGFYWGWIDGTGEFEYYSDQSVWYNGLKVSLPKENNPNTIDFSRR